jgi:hypothetical protein
VHDRIFSALYVPFIGVEFLELVWSFSGVLYCVEMTAVRIIELQGGARMELLDVI